MYNVVVVDDETWICKLIRKIVDWDSLGFSIIGSESDGYSALESIKEHKPELVITDIRMPGLDGIGLIKAVRDLKLDVEFIIISGHSDFEYARTALTLNAFAYILKPLDKDEFHEILQQVKVKIDNKRTIRNKLEKSGTVMLENDIRQIINRTKKDVSEEELNGLYGTKFGCGYFYAVIFKRDSISRETNESAQSEDYLSFLADIRDKHAGKFKEIVFFSEKAEKHELFIINTEKEDDAVVMDVMKDALKAFADNDIGKYNHLTISVGSRVALLSEIDASYAAAASAIKARVLLGVDRILDAKKEAHRINDTGSALDIRTKKKLTVLFDVLDIEGAISEISRVFKEAENHSSENLLIYHLTAYEIIDLLFDSMQRKNMTIRDGLTRQLAIQRVDGFISKSEMVTYISMLLKEFSNAYIDEKQYGGEKLIYEIKKFIAENYMSDINLDDIARLVCLNPTYVSEVFKRKTGVNFSEYLIDYRIDIAKDLLKDLRYKVIDISPMVGYRDSKYFSRLFKKKVGVNPSDYRRMYL